MMDERFQILTLDGGGIKGIFSAAVLAHFEEDLGINIVDHFDLIVGTSTGGIIALGLAIGMKPLDIVEFYINNGKRIFGESWPITPRKTIHKIRHWFHSKYSTFHLEKALKECFGKKRLGDSKKCLVVVRYDK